MTKAAFLSHQIPVQEFTIETVYTPTNRLSYVLNNMALATYSKLSGTPWLIKSDQGMHIELVIGLGSARIGERRLGQSERVVGITTVFTGDGNYCLSSVSKVVPIEEYQATLLATLKATLKEIRDQLNWRKEHHVRLVFHAFKPLKDAETEAVKELMESLGEYKVDYAFLHVIEDHPYLVFDEKQERSPRLREWGNEGRHGPQPKHLLSAIKPRAPHLAHRGEGGETPPGREPAAHPPEAPSRVEFRGPDLPRQAGLHLLLPFVAKLLPRPYARHHPLLRTHRPAPWTTLNPAQLGPGRHARSNRPHEVVPMNATDQVLLADVREALVRQIRAVSGKANLDEVFAAWVLGENDLGLSVEKAAQIATDLSETAPCYQHPAILGFAAEKLGSAFSHREALADRLVWVTGRDFRLGSSYAGFVTDPVAILGIALGAKSLGDEEIRRVVSAWIDSFVERSMAVRAIQDWERCLLAVACRVIGAAHQPPIPPCPSAAEFRTALRERALIPKTSKPLRDEEEREAIGNMKRQVLPSDTTNLAGCSMRLAALEAIIRMNTLTATRSTVFVSYSHKDKAWLERLHVHLKPLEREGKLDRWDDTRIHTSQRWREEIRKAIDAARVAVLLISADFLASDFIATDELPPLLSAAEDEGVAIMSVIVKPCRFKQTPSLEQFQAVNPGLKPLISMSESEQEELFVKLTEDIMRVVEGRS